MSKNLLNTSERLSPEDMCYHLNGFLMYIRHLCAYEFAKKVIPQDSFVLDMGFGEGYGTFNLSQYFAKVQGIDVNDDMLEYASQKYRSENCSYAVYDGVKIPYNDNTFDAVTSFQVIEHIKDSENFVKEIQRVLKPGGIFILTTPNSLLRLKPGQKPWNRFHVKEYNADELKKILETAFKKVQIFGVSGNDDIQRMEIRRLKRIRMIVSLDPLNIRSLLSEHLTHNISKIMSICGLSKKNKRNSINFSNEYSIADFHIEEKKIETSLDLLGVCYN